MIDRILPRLGPTWRASPLRRTIQTGCFLVFLGLFVYVCWPYTARPARVWPGWAPLDVDAETGRVTVVLDQSSADLPERGEVLHVVDAGADERAHLGAFRVARVEAGELDLAPVERLSPAEIDRLSTSFGPWSLSETEPGAWPSHYADSRRSKEKLPAETFLAIDPLVSLSTAVAARCWVWSLAAAGAVLLACLVIPRGFCAYVCPLGTILDLFDWALGKCVRSGPRITSLFRKGTVPLSLRENWDSPQAPFRPLLTALARRADGWWVHLKYYLLVGVLTAALFGVLLSGFVAAIPVVTRGMAFLLSPLQMGLARGWHQVPAWHAGHVVSLVLFFAVLGLGLLRPRFWCKYVCPTGAVFSVVNLFRLNERKVESSCIHCGRCVEICPFDAIKPDFTTRTTDCTYCRTCRGVCPKGSIKFAGRWKRLDLKATSGRPEHSSGTVPQGEGTAPILPQGTVPIFPQGTVPIFPLGKWDCPPPQPETSSSAPSNDVPTGETPLGRRGFLASAAGTVVGAMGGLGAAAAIKASGPGPDDPAGIPLVRPPGSVPERQFLQLCIRCGECFQACPNNVLQPQGFHQGFDGLWAPRVVADWSGCEPSCNNCGHVCPTGAIRALPLEEKRVARMGLAEVNARTCLPHAGKEACRLCVDECATAGYDAIEFVRVGTETDPFGQPIENSGFLAPVVLPHKCVGCGLCQTRCYAINAKAKGLLEHSAIEVRAGQGKEDRFATGSYAALRKEEERLRKEQQRKRSEENGADDSYLPDFLK